MTVWFWVLSLAHHTNLYSRAPQRKSRLMTTIRSNKPSRLEVAVHEAGHAIVQLATGPSPWIDYIEVGEPGEGRLGIVQTEALWQPSLMEDPHAPAELICKWRLLAARDIVMYLAGPMAELRMRHRRQKAREAAMLMASRCLAVDEVDAASDFGRVRHRLRWAHPGTEFKAFCQAWAATDMIVNTWWREIVDFGRMLECSGRINDVEIMNAWAGFAETRMDATISRAELSTAWSVRLLSGAR